MLTDARPEALGTARTTIGRHLDGAVERGKLTTRERDATWDRLSTAGSLAQACDGADLVIEAVARKGFKRCNDLGMQPPPPLLE